MLHCHGHHSALSPLISFYCPVRSPRPEVRPLLQQRDILQQLMATLQHHLLEEKEKERVQTGEAEQPVSFQLQKDGHFGLTLDTRGFSPEELCVKQVDRKLRVSGRTEKKQGDGKGSYSYRLQEFRQEIDLPEGLKAEALTCCLAPDGKLHIQAARAPPAEEAERELTIQRGAEDKAQQGVSSHAEDSNTETEDSTQDKDQNMD